MTGLAISQQQPVAMSYPSQPGLLPPKVRIAAPDEVKDWLADVLPQINRQALDDEEIKDD